MQLNDFIKQWHESNILEKYDVRRGNHWNYDKFCAFIKEKELQNRSQYKKWRKKKFPEKVFLPQHPENAYEKYWNGWDEAFKNT